jgi:hypothetical protein
VDAAHQRVSSGLVLADAAFDSERKHEYIRTVLQACSIMPAKRRRADWRIQGMCAQMRQCFPRNEYSQRAWIDSVISAVKRK